MALHNKKPTLVLLIALAMSAAGSDAHATDPEELCNDHDTLVSQLTGKPHFERQALLLKDELPSQRHRLELFMNAGEGGRHTYSLLRTRRGHTEACIVTAGLIAGRTQDKFGHPHMMLNDENDPETFEFVGCDGRYVILRSGIDVGPEIDICKNMETLARTPRVVVSFGQIAQDHRSEIPWPDKKR